MTRIARIRWINATAIVLAFFGFAFSPWLGSRSALGLLVELADFLRASSPGADIGRQQAIFAILGGVLLCLFFQTLAFGMKVRSGKRGFVFQEVIFAILALALLALLFLAFQAQTTGLFVTAISISVAALAALLEPRQDETPALTLPAQVLPPAEPKAEPEAEPKAEPGDPMVDFQRQVAQAFRRAHSSNKPFSLAMIGLPDFQEMTDAFGPRGGRRDLRQIGQRSGWPGTYQHFHDLLQRRDDGRPARYGQAPSPGTLGPSGRADEPSRLPRRNAVARWSCAGPSPRGQPAGRRRQPGPTHRAGAGRLRRSIEICSDQKRPRCIASGPFLIRTGSIPPSPSSQTASSYPPWR